MGAITSLVIQFGSDAAADYILEAEIDSRPASEGGLNKGKTNFMPGDDVYFLVYASKELTVATPVCTLPSPGAVESAGTGTIAVDEYVTMVNVSEQNLPKPTAAAFTPQLMSGSTAPDLRLVGDKLVTSEPALAVVKCEYNAPYTAWKLTGVPDDLDGETTFPVIVFITADVTPVEEVVV